MFDMKNFGKLVKLDENAPEAMKVFGLSIKLCLRQELSTYDRST